MSLHCNLVLSWRRLMLDNAPNSSIAGWLKLQCDRLMTNLFVRAKLHLMQFPFA